MVIVTLARERSTLLLGFACFIVMGMMNSLLGVAWPSIRQTFGLPLDALVALLAASTIGYSAGSVLTSRLITRIGAGWSLLLATFLGAVGVLGYVLAPGWWVMVAFGLLTGWANGTISTVLNITVAATGTVRVMNWMHACFGIGATIGPLLMTAIIGAGGSWRLGYAISAGTYVALALLYFTVVRTMTFRGLSHGAGSDLSERPTRLGETLRLPIVWLSILLFLLYTGVETTAGQWLFTWFTESRAATAYAAGLMTSSFWAMLTIGRLVFGAGAAQIGVERLLRLSMVGVVLATLMLLVRSLPLGFLAIGLMGLSLAVIFPTLTSDTPHRVGARHAANTIGLQAGAAAFGLALLPGLAGVLAERVGLEALGPFLVISSLLMLLVNQLAVGMVRRGGS